MSKKKLFWIAFFGMTLVEIGQMAYSHDHQVIVMNSSEFSKGQCEERIGIKTRGENTSVYGQPRLMLI